MTQNVPTPEPHGPRRGPRAPGLAELAKAAPPAAEAGIRPRDADQLCVDAIRMLAIDMTNAANSGHPGLPMGMADVAYVLWTNHLRHDPDDAQWRDRDRFVLSAGHGSALIYALLHLTGYDLPMEEVRRFRQFGSRTPGHPEHGVTDGVEVTTGPLGQGIANAVGIALAQAMTAARFGSKEFPVATGRTFGIVSDGDLMEGISAEAASLAGHWRLANLKLCYDANRISIDGSTDLAFTEDVARRFEAHGWHVVACDGHDRTGFAKAFDDALAVTDRPSLVVCRTVIGRGAPNRQGTEKAHGAPLGADETKLTKDGYGWSHEPFLVPREVYARFAERLAGLRAARARWDATVAAWKGANPEAWQVWDGFHRRAVPSAAALLERLAKAAGGSKATRQHSQAVLQKAAAEVPNLVGGSADLTHSNLTWIDGAKPVGPAGTRPAAPEDFLGRNVHFGVREHAMGAIANGIAAHGAFVPYTATFLAFLDYMRTPVRLASLSRHGTIFVFSHDSIGLGEDGPTHQPVEHLWTARMIPGMTVHRPADGLETAAAWADAIARRDGPTVIVTTRQKLPELQRPAGFEPAHVLRGGYVVHEPEGGDAPELVLIATGSEVGAAVDAAKRLAAKDVRARVVSMPSVELFDRQDAAWKASVLPEGVRRVAIEAGRPDGWYRFTGLDGLVVGIETFGASAPAEALFDHFGLTGPKLADRIAAWLAV